MNLAGLAGLALGGVTRVVGSRVDSSHAPIPASSDAITTPQTVARRLTSRSSPLIERSLFVSRPYLGCARIPFSKSCEHWAELLAWEVRKPGPIDSGPLVAVDRAVPEPGPKELLVRVSACGVCRTDLHIAEGDLEVRRRNVVPGHEIVGHVEALGEDCSRFTVGDRVGIAWLRSTCGRCRFCERGDTNLCLDPSFTGWDADGGYAQFAVAPEDYTYSLKDGLDDVHSAPLLCAGIIGYRALKRAELPTGGALGIYGFGGSAHIAMQVAIHRGARVHVMTRSEKAQRLATKLGATSARGPFDKPPEPLDAAILFAPAGEVVPAALAALDRGGTLSIAGIHVTDIPSLNYRDHLFYERNMTSVTANTLDDGREFMDMALSVGVKTSVQTYSLRDADSALSDLAHGRVGGAAVLVNDV